MSNIIKLKAINDTKYVVGTQDVVLTPEQISFFEGLPLYYDQVNLEVEQKDGNIIIHHATFFSNEVISNLTHDDVVDWFYHSCSNTSTVINSISKPLFNWNKLDEFEKDWLREKFKTSSSEGKSLIKALVGDDVSKNVFRTWKDVESYFNITDDDIDIKCPKIFGLNEQYELVKKICKSIIKTHVLINMGYGGVITDVEYSYYEHERFWGYVKEEHTGDIICTPIDGVRTFPVFHTEEQARKFGSYPENLELLRIILA